MAIRTKGGRTRFHRPLLSGVLATAALALGAVPATAAVRPVTAKAGFKGTLNILGFGTNGDDVAQTRLKLAEKAIAPAKINAPNGGFSDAAFLADIASGNVPDLVYMNSAYLGEYAAIGAIQPISACISRQHINTGEFTKGAQAMASYNGKFYGLPEFTDDRTLIVNNTAVRQAGLTTADVSTSNWSKLSR